MFRKNDIWTTRQSRVMEAKSVAGGMKAAPHKKLRPRILRPDSSHIAPANLRRMDVAHHTTMPSCCPVASDFSATM
jgi:hypothetical protein